MQKKIKFNIRKQPNNITCGPTSLQAIYEYYGDYCPLKKIVKEIQGLKDGGTLGVHLACHALKRGYSADIYTYNLKVFDPTWFTQKVNILDKLKKQIKAKKNDKKLCIASKVYITYLELGGQLHFKDLNPQLIRRFLNKSIPILTGLSSTYLYRAPREMNTKKCQVDDVHGLPTGHFVVLHGYSRAKKQINIADPYTPNPISQNSKYTISVYRLINAILLGILTYDANLLILKPKKTKK